MAKLCIKFGAKIKTLSDDGKNLLLVSSIHNNDKPMAEFLIAQKIDLYAIDEENYTALHHAVENENLDFLLFFASLYDIKKCHQMKSLLGLSDQAKINTFLKTELGLEVEKKISDKSNNISVENSSKIFHAFNNKLQELKKQLASEPDLLKQLPDYKTWCSDGTLIDLEEKLQHTFDVWADYYDTPLQALYLEYQGAVVEPFDGYGLLSGFEKCNDSLDLSDCVFEEEGDLDLTFLFSGINTLLEKHDPYYSEIKDYFNYSVYILLNLILERLSDSESFKQLEKTQPFYLICCEHDEEKILVFQQ